MPLYFILKWHSVRVTRTFKIKNSIHQEHAGNNTMNRHEMISALFSSACQRWLAVLAKVCQSFCAAPDSDTFFRARINGHSLSARGRLSLRRDV
jgi:hypothetical protein